MWLELFVIAVLIMASLFLTWGAMEFVIQRVSGECFLFHDWDDKHAATRTCKRCGRVEVMSHL